MASPQQDAANRHNAYLSTGPRTLKGKARARLNALRHGLAARLPAAGVVDREVERLASAIAGPNSDRCRWHFATVAAEAELELRRVRAVRLSLFTAGNSADATAFNAEQEECVATATFINLPSLDRYEQRALSRRNRALRLL
jgi:hypothetical protein